MAVCFVRGKLTNFPIALKYYQCRWTRCHGCRNVVKQLPAIAAHIVAATLLWLIAYHLIIINATVPASFQAVENFCSERPVTKLRSLAFNRLSLNVVDCPVGTSTGQLPANLRPFVISLGRSRNGSTNSDGNLGESATSNFPRVPTRCCTREVQGFLAGHKKRVWRERSRARENLETRRIVEWGASRCMGTRRDNESVEPGTIWCRGRKKSAINSGDLRGSVKTAL